MVFNVTKAKQKAESRKQKAERRPTRLRQHQIGMSRTFLASLGGLSMTIFSWFSPWAWPAWPALTLLDILPRPANYGGRAAVVVALIAINSAVWAGIFYAMSRPWLRRLSALCLLLSAFSVHAEKAIFASGCFWCTESDFEKVPGVTSVVSGYSGGDHRESVEVTFDEAKVTYAQLLDRFWHSVDPLNGHGQFCDGGRQYRSGIFYFNDAQKRAAEASKAAVVKRFGKAYTDVLPVSAFDPADEHDQDYAKKHPVRYRFYRWNCGRDQRLEEIWGAPVVR
jgi:peptide-methionine (S)-S-oxide reductase